MNHRRCAGTISSHENMDIAKNSVVYFANMPPRAAALVVEFCQGEQQEGAGRDDDRVGRRQQGADSHDGCKIEQQACGSAYIFVSKEHRRGAPDGPGRRQSEQHRHAAGPKRGIAKQADADTDHHRIQRRVIKEARREMFGVAPVQHFI